MTEPTPRMFLTVDEVALALGYQPGGSNRAGRMRVHRLINAGRIRAVRLGRSLRIPVSEIERLARA